MLQRESLQFSFFPCLAEEVLEAWVVVVVEVVEVGAGLQAVVEGFWLNQGSTGGSGLLVVEAEVVEVVPTVVVQDIHEGPAEVVDENEFRGVQFHEL